ncbi:interferon-induced very large GTPase 1-like [Mercenaria mercenaria]|uniref:interferon-induced very large GTPase 1-like n=1 Tax=Mercenaria mercenaria TaxID=6596 RepID=UPI00234EE9B9|nr:interferon-induced very large GTPase 1-like [Mercenaria mercenaria]
MLQVANVISEKIEIFQKDIVKTTLKDCLSNIENKNVKIDETEQACVEGKRIATDIIEAMGTEKDAPLLWKRRVTPAHSLYSRRLGENNMKIRREQDTTRIEQLRHEMDDLRKEQIKNITPAIKLFARYLVSKAESPSCLRFILAWLNIFIQVEKQKLLPQLIKENRTAWTRMGDIKSKSNPNSEDIAIQRESIKRTENQIQEASFSIELLFHEIGHIYDTIIILRKDSTSVELPSVKTMLEVCASLFVEGNTLELIDGEAFHMSQHWIGKVFEKVSEIMGSPKVLTMSILGIQSSGKSTLLNTMFGSQFPTSVGRCTKGIQMKLLPLRIDNLFQYILVLDTEGLRAPDDSDEKCNFDNQMATIITGLGDITVMNVMGENAMAIRDILQVVVHAFLRLKLADPNIDLRKRCTFIHHNVSSVMALDKMRPSVSKLMEILDSVTKDAAEMEGIADVVEFNQIIQFDMTSQVWFLPNLLEGCPPRIKCEYSSQAADIKSKLLQLAISDTEKSYGSLNDVIMHARDLWKGVLTEDFVFYFRNSEEIRAYNLLESKILHWLSELQCFCRKKCVETSQEVFQKCSEQQELEGATEAANELIFDDLHKKEIEVKLEIDKCFNENEFKNAICRWKDETTARFEYTCMDLRNSIKKETERFRQKRSIEIFQNSNRAEHEDKLHKKSVKLAKDAKDLSVEEINKQFENIWQEFVKEIENKSHVPTICIFKKRLHEMYKNDASLHGLIDEQTLQFNTPDHFSGNLSDLLSEKLNFLLKDVLQVTNTLTNIENIIQSYITRPYSIKDENISLFLEEVEKEIKCKSTWKNESLKMKTKAEILVIICCYSSRLFDKHNIDPRTHQSEPLSEKHVHNYLYKLFATERAIVCQMINQKPPSASLKLRNIEEYADDISIPRHFFNVSKIIVSDKKKISLVRPHVDKILSETRLQIDELCQTDTEMSEFNIKTVLYNAKKDIENLKTHKNEFTLTNRFTIRICVHVGEYAYSKFQKQNELYQEKIARRLTNYKQSVRAQFDAYLSDRKQEDTAALLISSEIETIAREAIRLFMPSKVLRELRKTTIPRTKLDLIIDMLTDMAEGEKFFPFTFYIESPSEYAEAWITKQSKNYLFAENSTGYFKIASRRISKIFEDIYNAINATTDLLKHCPPTLEMWMEQLNKNLKQCRILDENIRNAKREIITIQNVTNFNRILLINLKKSKNKLTSEAKKETEDTIVWGSLNPYKEVFRMYWGCEEQCRYCGEPCCQSKHDEKSSKHRCLQHRPGCCSGIQDSASKTAMLETCNFNVQKLGKSHNCLAFNFVCYRLAGKPCDDNTMHLFKDYRKYLPYWDIKPDMDMSENSEFWMWFVATYKKQLADYYGYDVSNVPESWLCISKESAIGSLRR